MGRIADVDAPFVWCPIVERDPAAVRATMRAAVLEGAAAFEIHLPMLDYPDAAALADLADATTRPVIATCRRAEFYTLVGYPAEDLDAIRRSDEGRVEALTDAVRAGFDGADFELDTFGEGTVPPDDVGGIEARLAREAEEVTLDPEAVARQERAVEAIQDLGGEVLLSCHPGCHLAPEEAAAIAGLMADRGADLAKIVGVDESLAEVLDTLEANLRLRDALEIPFTMMSMGPPSRVGRPFYPFFGSSWVYCQVEHRPGGFEAWPTVENAREILRRVDDDVPLR